MWNSLQEILAIKFMKNSVEDWLSAIGIIVISYLIARFVKRVCNRYFGVVATKVHSEWLKAFAALPKHTSAFLLTLVVLHFSPELLKMNKVYAHLVEQIALGAFFLQFALWVDNYVKEVARLKSERMTIVDPGHVGVIHAVTWFLRSLVWFLLAVLALDNMGINVSTLVTGLGIGGVAIALAVQNILGDLFCSLTILLDKPFAVGDSINVGDKTGTVEHIGLKSTRLRSIHGELIVISNSDLVRSRVLNYKQMNERRVLLNLGVVYHSSVEQLRMIPGLIKQAITDAVATRFDRANFIRFGASSLDFEGAYYVLSADYKYFLEIQEKVNLKVFELFAEHGIEFAYPTQTVMLEKPEKMEKFK